MNSSSSFKAFLWHYILYEALNELLQEGVNNFALLLHSENLLFYLFYSIADSIVIICLMRTSPMIVAVSLFFEGRECVRMNPWNGT